MAEPADLNLDELKRRGRRRLIGAIVLALVAAVVVPMLLESEPRPLGEDVSVRIPPVDEGRFVSKLGESRPKAESAKVAPAPAVPPPAAPAVAAPDAAPAAKEAPPAAPAASAQDAAPRKSVADAEKAVLAPASRAAPAKANGNAVKATAAPKDADAAAARPPAAEAPAKPADADAKAAPAREGFAVQLAAFSDDKGANALANKLKRAGYPAFTETVATSQKTLWRVRVGPYPSREAAAQSRDRLKAEGHPGIVVAAR